MPPSAPPAPPRGDTTFGLQHTLPKLPLPSLDATCDTLGQVLPPLCADDAEARRALELVAELRGSEAARRAQAVLEQRCRDCDNWVDEWWGQYAYFAERNPLVPMEGDCFAGDPLGRQLSQTERAATIVHARARRR